MTLEELYRQYRELEEQANDIADEIIAYSKRYGTDNAKLNERLLHNAHVRQDILLPDMLKLLVEKELKNGPPMQEL